MVTAVSTAGNNTMSSNTTSAAARPTLQLAGSPLNSTAWWWGDVVELLQDFTQLRAAGLPDCFCKNCNKSLKFHGNTGNVGRHVESCVKPKALTADGAAAVVADAGGQKKMPAFMEQKPAFEQQVTRWMVKRYKPFSEVNQEEFRGMFRCLVPNLRFPSDRDMARNVEHLADWARANIREALSKQFPSLTTDAWTSGVNEAYLALTCHYIDVSMNLVSLPLECAPFPGSHTAERIFNKTVDLLERNGISDERVAAVVADNAANQVAAGNLAAFDSLSCGPHTLQLTVKKILDEPVIAAVLKKVRKIVGSFKHSAVKCEELQLEQKLAELPELRLRQDVPTRWSSTFLCLERFVQFRQCIDVVCARHGAPKAKTASQKAPKASSSSTSTISSSTSSSRSGSSSSSSRSSAKQSTQADVSLPQSAFTRAVTRQYSGALVTEVGKLADIDSDVEDDGFSSDDGDVEDERYSESNDASSSEVIAIASSDSSNDDSGNDGASDFDDVLPAAAAAAAASKRKRKAATSTTDSKRRKNEKRERFMKKLTDDEWDLLELLLELLRPFHKTQTFLEGDKYVTRSWLPMHIHTLRKHLHEHASSSSSSDLEDADADIAETLPSALSAAAQLLLEDFDARWPAEWSLSTCLTVALDPRTKFMNYLSKQQRDDTWESISREMQVLHELQKRDEQHQLDTISSRQSTAPVTATPPSPAKSESSVDLSVNPDADSDDADTYNGTVEDAVAINLKHRIASEMQLYKREQAIGKQEDPLQWWRQRLETYPLLAVVARKWLAVPASSASSERVFSSAGLTVTKLRNRLKPKRVAELVFLHTAWDALEAQGILYTAPSREVQARSGRTSSSSTSVSGRQKVKGTAKKSTQQKLTAGKKQR